MSEWIKITKSLESGLRIVDRVENGKFRALVNHICLTLQSGNDSGMYTQEEENKLIASLEVDKKTLVLLMNTIKLVYLQAAYRVVKPVAMETLMKESFPVSNEKVTVFTNAWISHGRGIIDALRQKSIFPTQMEDINWELNIQSASSAASREVNPVVWLQMGLKEAKGPSKITLEMNKNELTTLYNKFEDIQHQLDLLEWAPEKSGT